MNPAPLWEDGSTPSLPALPSPTQNALPGHMHAALPGAVEAALWRGDQLGGPTGLTLTTGFAALDAALPGGGWPCQGLVEVLAAQYSLLEWRLLSPMLRAVSDAGKPIVVIGPPKPPFAPGLRDEGINERQLIWIDVDTPAQRLWATEQVIKANSAGVLMSWLPLVRHEQIRRMQVLAGTCEAPTFLFRLSDAAQESSAAPLRLLGSLGVDWELNLQVLKRKGPPLEETLVLPSVPRSIERVMTPRLKYPSRLVSRVPDVVVSPPATNSPRQHAH